MERTIIDSQPNKFLGQLQKIFDQTCDPPGICPVRDVLDRIGDKWSILSILYLGYKGRMRFNELRKNISGVSQRMLTVTLRSLERDGYITRKIYAEVPPRVEYELTPLGLSLLEQVLGLATWAHTHIGEIVAARSTSLTDKN